LEASSAYPNTIVVFTSVTATCRLHSRMHEKWHVA
jgi:hypothetical protein